MVPLINNAGSTLRWYVEDVWGCFDADHTRPGAPLCSERRNIDGSAARVGAEVLRSALARAASDHLRDWAGRVTPHVLRPFCASELYGQGMDLVAIQEVLGHAWIATTIRHLTLGYCVRRARNRRSRGHGRLGIVDRALERQSPDQGRLAREPA